MLTRIALVALAGIVGISTGACAGNSNADGPRIGGTGAEWFQIEVRNNTPSTLRVLASDRGQETPLGRVDPLSESTLRVPASSSGQIRLVARPGVAMLADRVHVSEPIVLQRGQRVVWELIASPGISDVPRLSTIRVMSCPPGAGC